MRGIAMSDQQDRKEIWPVHVVRHGAIEAAIWERHDATGNVTHQVSLSRIYKTRDGEWNRTSVFDRKQLPVVMACAEQAQSWVRSRELQLTQRKVDAAAHGRSRGSSGQGRRSVDGEAKQLLRQLIDTLGRKNHRGISR
jgi:hypothetical protein